MPGGAAINGEVSRFPGDMRGDAGLPEAGDKLGGVMPFGRAQGQASGRSGGMTMHRAMVPTSVRGPWRGSGAARRSAWPSAGVRSP